MLPGANVARVLARSGVDWVLVDCEHGNIDGISSLSLVGPWCFPVSAGDRHVDWE